MKRLIPTSSFLLLFLLLSPDPGEGLPLLPITACCTQLYRKPLPDTVLRNVVRVEIQKADGDCHLQAYMLHLSHRIICIHPKNRSLALWFEHEGKRFQDTLTKLNLKLKEKRAQRSKKAQQ
ncbi:C-C motif chemokine 27 isoform X2 [Suncus etruscus]|uniref:C-C motif chemokine 27 isoform X2 n=1 Tax=Suncus etruscus TaxID=109475 RepID=UPI0021102813|nr:C-C motif chemokine 27 isoform X2 [Suncus etruscus]